MGLALAAPAGAQELVDVAALEARLEAAGELAELPTEPDWGVTESVESVPAVSDDAPQVPVVSAAQPAADVTEVRYHTPEPQYHTEYQPSAPAPAHEDPLPAPEPAARPADPAPVTPTVETEPAQTAETAGGQTETRATEPAAPPANSTAPASASTPAQTAPSAAPTIWIWIWNWNWTTVSEGRYQNSAQQYQIDETILGTDVAKGTQSGLGKGSQSGISIPAQIDVKTGIDIVDAIQRDISSVATIGRQVTREINREVARETREVVLETKEVALGEAGVALDDALRPLSAQAPTPGRSVAAGDEAARSAPVRKRQARVRAFASASAHDGQAHDMQAVVASSSASYFASGDVARVSRHTKRTAARARLHRAAAPKAPLQTNEERLGESSTANGGGVGFLLKTIAILTASMLLAALGYGLRIWLPETRWRGLLGTRPDPPG